MNPHPISSAADLVTPRAAIIEGFIEQARMKSEEAAPFVAEAKRFVKALSGVKSESDLHNLLADPETRDALISAAGLSDKARGHLSENELDQAALNVLHQFFSMEEGEFGEEILYRYLLTKGDALGGKMRNLIGGIAEEKFASHVVAALQSQKINPRLGTSRSNKVNRIQWGGRLTLFNRTPKFIGKNIDFIMLDLSIPHQNERELLEMPMAYLTCGELKGGIDPAGADEHWKTARSALNRIAERFEKKGMPHPSLFFVGAAVAKSMAKEIYADLQSGKLAYAANLTQDDQVRDLADWIVSL